MSWTLVSATVLFTSEMKNVSAHAKSAKTKLQETYSRVKIPRQINHVSLPPRLKVVFSIDYAAPEPVLLTLENCSMLRLEYQNLSDTAFWMIHDCMGRYHVRWFIPAGL